MSTPITNSTSAVEMNIDVSGEFVTLSGERYYAIRNVDNMAPFFISLVSDSDHWLFVSSNGGLTAGRVSPETALFPYITVDRIYESTSHTGNKTLLRVSEGGEQHDWQPFNKEQDGQFAITRNLYKNLLGNKLVFEEVNHDLQMVFRYNWVTSDSYGFARQCELENTGNKDRKIELLDGLQNVLPAGTPRFTQTNSSYLVDAYKWSELDENTGLAMFSLFSGITDRAEPCESLKTTTVFSLGLENNERKVLLSSEQLDDFCNGGSVQQETHKRGIRGAYWVNAKISLSANSSHRWQLVANIEQTQSEAVSLIKQLSETDTIAAAIEESVEKGSDQLARIMAAGDGFQLTNEELVTVHHYANVQFNILRGGIFDNQYQVSSKDFNSTLELFNAEVYQRHQSLLESLPEQIDYNELLTLLSQQNDSQLDRLTYEYLPITFGRRHGDPSRPWNQFAIKLHDEQGDRLLSYQGNWRDIFQNWEALMLSYPEYIQSVIAKFVNASTVDGYNPYRITKEGIDWEVEEPDDPWSYIGYWGDHQIIYLQKLLELSQQFHPAELSQMLSRPIFCYANVPYKIKPFDALIENAKSTVEYDDDLAEKIEQRVEQLGSDGKLLLNAQGQVYQVNLFEKLLVPLLSKLSNLVVDGGIWLNTQRPEWNDANNALVGQGLSMVTLYYMRRYMKFFQQLLSSQSDAFTLSSEVSQWLTDISEALTVIPALVANDSITDEQRYQLLEQLGKAACSYREQVYRQEGFSGTVSQDLQPVTQMLENALLAIDHSIATNLRKDGLYNAYNVLEFKPKEVVVDELYPMLEGQVAALSSGAIAPKQAVELLETLFDSSIYRPDQHTFLLYPDRELPSFLEKNCLPAEKVESSSLLVKMLANTDSRVVEKDASGIYRFNADITNVDDLDAHLDGVMSVYGENAINTERQSLHDLYESVFNHKAFTGRSGGMFGFEGLGSIYWHMVSKLLLAVQESFFASLEGSAAEHQAIDQESCQQLGELYYRVREGIGFNKTPEEYGAFPTDPYSHTPLHIGAQQPGMTGQVKEEMITRFAELGLRVNGGAVRFETNLLRAREFLSQPKSFRYLDVKDQWQETTVPSSGLAFSWCQVPIVYRLDDSSESRLTVTLATGEQQVLPSLALPAEMAKELFKRTGQIQKVELVLNSGQLFSE